MTNRKNRISIQVGLSGYSFEIEADITRFTPKFTLVPYGFYSPDKAWDILSEVTALDEGDKVDVVELPEFNAILLFSGQVGGLYNMLKKLPELKDYNKILASYSGGYLYLVIAQGKSLLLCNSFRAPDFTTAEYFIFLAMKKLQLNPEISTITFGTELSDEEEMSLYRYFKNVDQI